MNYRSNTQSKFNWSKTKVILLSDSIVIFHVLNNIFFYTQVVSADVLDNTDAFFFFFSKTLISFICFFSESFFVFLIIFIYRKKIYKKYFYKLQKINFKI